MLNLSYCIWVNMNTKKKDKSFNLFDEKMIYFDRTLPENPCPSKYFSAENFSEN
jgi:hypothetical protein